MCDEAVDDFLLAIKFVPDWFVRSKMIKTPYNAFFTDGYMIHSFLMKIQTVSHFLVMKRVFLV